MFSKLFNTKAKEQLSEIEDDIKTKTIMLKTIKHDIESEYKKLEKLRAEIADEVQKQHVAKYDALGSYTASVDWKAMNAFSIERAYAKTIESVHVTTIGYVVGGNVREWILFTNKENHEKLVNEFNEYVKAKNNV